MSNLKESSSILRVCFALSKWRYFHRTYLVTIHKGRAIIVFHENYLAFVYFFSIQKFQFLFSFWCEIQTFKWKLIEVYAGLEWSWLLLTNILCARMFPLNNSNGKIEKRNISRGKTLEKVVVMVDLLQTHLWNFLQNVLHTTQCGTYLLSIISFER